MTILSEFLLNPELKSGLFIVLNLVLIESLLSVDNAAVLAAMVVDLPQQQRVKALRYGIIGAYVFRGICLLLAGWLVKIWWLKPLGGLYLVYLCYDYFKPKTNDGSDEAEKSHSDNKLFKWTSGFLSPFWATVCLVEVMDLAFSIDNVFAAVAFTDKLYLIYIGVFIGILAMRFVAQGFVSLLEKYPFLEAVAFCVIGVLGVKLLLSGLVVLAPEQQWLKVIDEEKTDAIVSIGTLLLFVVPVFTSKLFNWPSKNK